MEENPDKEKLDNENLDNENLKNENPDNELDKKQTPPAIPQPPVKSNDEVWAETLGVNFDPEKAQAQAEQPAQQPAQQPAPGAPQPVFGGYYPAAPAQQQQPGQQPDMQPGQQPPMPPTYLFWAIAATLVCCLPAGVVAIIYASSVSTKYFSRDYAGAERASKNAQIWIIVSIVAGIVWGSLYIPLSILMQ